MFSISWKFLFKVMSGVMSPLTAQLNEANAPGVPFSITQIGRYQYQPNGQWQPADWDGGNWIPRPGETAPDDVREELDRYRREILDMDAAKKRAVDEFLKDRLLFPPIPGIDQTCNRYYKEARNLVIRRDPLVLDLDGDGIELVAASGAVLFDHNADGIKTGTGWAKSDDGFLVRDVDGNGTIDTGRELFGVDTIKSNGGLASDGFDALRDIDSNGDGFFTNADAAYADLRVWRDLDQNGISTANELFTLADLGITSIATNGTTTGPQAGQLIANNRVALSSTFTQNGTTHTVGASVFSRQALRRQYMCDASRTQKANPLRQA